MADTTALIVASDSDSDSDSDSSSDSNGNAAVPSAPPIAPPTDAAPNASTPNEGAKAASMEPELSNIQAIPIRKTLIIVNNFVINTTKFINNFAVVCENKLNKVHQDIHRLHVLLAILEAKLNSIDWLGGGLGDSSALNAAPTFDSSSSAPNGVPAAPPVGAGVPAAPPVGAAAAPAAAEEVKEAVPAPAANTVPVSEDPAYAKYFKMLKMGVPVPQLKMKMQSEGVDPDIIDMNPMDPSPGGGNPSTALVVMEDISTEEELSEVSD